MAYRLPAPECFKNGFCLEISAFYSFYIRSGANFPADFLSRVSTSDIQVWADANNMTQVYSLQRWLSFCQENDETSRDLVPLPSAGDLQVNWETPFRADEWQPGVIPFYNQLMNFASSADGLTLAIHGWRVKLRCMVSANSPTDVKISWVVWRRASAKLASSPVLPPRQALNKVYSCLLTSWASIRGIFTVSGNLGQSMPPFTGTFSQADGMPIRSANLT